ncbi:MAG: hypothetical protein ACP59X_19035 [Solidesulfovibrio sp. DCME]|uniref:hypothetical protein n=1 Tax=Solidesulfovibrio sp. DCME TaxID=3447380 RepID=UPI003D0F6116
MSENEERRLPGQGDGAKNETSKTLLPSPAPVVNTSDPRLWRALGQFDRNLKKIIWLREENAALLEEMRRLQGAL